ncbi:hypothetical protein DE146DRAFT_626470 [Phaeosphaeria sp. MPI-PUGE-AT-0046c]|nr:hypothetical protein DE146DRAFT_626470 [Phaeosphaeria sp. MPI-PUGE-AT-0046c]
MASETSTFSAEAVPGRLAAARASCKIRPVVMIFNSKPRHPSQNTKKPRKLHATAPGKAFAFVNTSRPGKADEETRRLVKTHVMQNVLRRKSQGFSKLEVNFLPSLCLSENSPQPIRSSPQAPPSYLLTFPIHTEPYMLKMVHDCAYKFCPSFQTHLDSYGRG